jgi:hypothetical protein
LFEAEPLARLRRRAERASAAGKGTFAIPELAPVAEFVAGMVPPGLRRTEAELWLEAGASYHALVRLVGRAMMGLDDAEATGSAVYLPKAAGELEPILRLWPAVLAVPALIAFKPRDLVRLRAFPVHPLGLVSEAAWADGDLCSPAEFFFHDLDHARFKIREDLRVEGIEIPDAYQGGTTVDVHTGQHRIILTAAQGRIGSALWNRVEARRELADRLLARAASLGGPRAAAANLLLFEMLHEKSLPLDASVLVRELASEVHMAKIRRKHASGFYGEHAPRAMTLAALDEARSALAGIL